MEIFSYLLGKKAGGDAPSPVYQQKNITITENKTTNITADEGYDALSKVTVTTNVTGTVSPQYVSFANYDGASLDISWLRTDNMTTMKQMFNNCTNLTSIDLSEFDTSNVTNFQNFLYNCSRLKAEDITGLSGLDTSKIENFNACFSRAFINTGVGNSLDLSNWSFESATTCSQMFYSCASYLVYVKLDSANNPNLTDVSQMFASITSSPFNLNIDNFDVSNVTNAQNMFNGCNYLSDDSLNSIMKAFTDNTGLAVANKTLKYLGLNSTLANKCTTLSNWTDMQSAGWSTGY